MIRIFPGYVSINKMVHLPCGVLWFLITNAAAFVNIILNRLQGVCPFPMRKNELIVKGAQKSNASEWGGQPSY